MRESDFWNVNSIQRAFKRPLNEVKPPADVTDFERLVGC